MKWWNSIESRGFQAEHQASYKEGKLSKEKKPGVAALSFVNTHSPLAGILHECTFEADRVSNHATQNFEVMILILMTLAASANVLVLEKPSLAREPPSGFRFFIEIPNIFTLKILLSMLPCHVQNETTSAVQPTS
jgi:hypothetical protein